MAVLSTVVPSAQARHGRWWRRSFRGVWGRVGEVVHTLRVVTGCDQESRCCVRADSAMSAFAKRDFITLLRTLPCCGIRNLVALAATGG